MQEGGRGTRALQQNLGQAGGGSGRRLPLNKQGSGRRMAASLGAGVNGLLAKAHPRRSSLTHLKAFVRRSIQAGRRSTPALAWEPAEEAAVGAAVDAFEREAARVRSRLWVVWHERLNTRYDLEATSGGDWRARRKDRTSLRIVLSHLFRREAEPDRVAREAAGSPLVRELAACADADGVVLRGDWLRVMLRPLLHVVIADSSHHHLFCRNVY